ncbi:MAG TPA: TlpA disulfide reductase family protein [Ktedonobacterales bacterium]
MSETQPVSPASSASPASPASPASSSTQGPPLWSQDGWRGLLATSPRSLISLALTSLFSGALLLILLVRLIAAGHAAATVAPYPLVGHAAPDFNISLWNGQSGQKLHLADLKGKPVVVNFWAWWCDSCTQEMPMLEDAYKHYSAQGVVFVGMSYVDAEAQSTSFLQQHSITYPVGPDATGEVSVAYGVTGVPETVFIGRDGKIVSKVPAQLDEKSLAAGLAGIVK